MRLYGYPLLEGGPRGPRWTDRPPASRPASAPNTTVTVGSKSASGRGNHTSVFSQPTTFTRGNAPRTLPGMRGGGTNHPGFQFGLATFGVVSAAGNSPRQVLLAAKGIF